MGYSKRSRDALRDLSTDELRRLLNDPVLRTVCARLVNTNVDSLAEGRAKSIRALRTGMTRQPDVFIDHISDALAGTGHASGPSDPSDEAAGVGSSIDHALRLWLSDRASSDPEGGQATAETAPDDDPHIAPASPEKVTTGPAAESTREEQNLEGLVSRAIALLEHGARLSGRVHSAADDLGSGRPTSLPAGEVTNWSAAVREILGRKVDGQIVTDLVGFAEVARTARERLGRESGKRARLEAELVRRRDVQEVVGLLVRQGQSPEFIAQYIRLNGVDPDDIVDSWSSPVPATSASHDSDRAADPESSVSQTVSVATNTATEPDESKPTNAETQALAGTPETINAPPGRDKPQPFTAAPGDVRVTVPPEGPALLTPAPDGPAPGHSVPGVREVSDHPVAQEPPSPAADETSVDAAVSLPDFPWDEGDPSLIAALLDAGHDAAAYLVSVTGQEELERQRLLELIVCGVHCTSQTLELNLHRLLPNDDQITRLTTDESRVLLTGALIAGLKLGYPPVSVETLLERSDLHDSRARPLLQAICAAVQRGYIRGGEQLQDLDQITSQWSTIGQQADDLLRDLHRRRTNFPRATRVLQYLATHGTVLASLNAASELAGRGVQGAMDTGWSVVEHAASELADNHRRRKLINDADRQVSTPQQTRASITALALRQLNGHLDQVQDLLTGLLGQRRAALATQDTKTRSTVEELGRELTQLPQLPPSRTVGDAAVRRLVAWLRADTTGRGAPSVQAVLSEALLVVPNLTRDADGNPTEKPTTAQLRTLWEPPSPEEVVDRHIRTGNIHAARDYLAREGLDSRDWDDRLLKGTRKTQAAYKSKLAAARRMAARLRSLNLDDDARSITAQTENLGGLDDPGRYDLVIGPLEAISQDAQNTLDRTRAKLRERARQANCGEQDRGRILARIDDDDETLAIEYLTLIDSGVELPAAEPASGDDFAEFFPRIVREAESAQQGSAIDATRRLLGAQGQPEDRLLRSGLADWATLRGQRRNRESFAPALANVLRMLGLNPRENDWRREITRVTRSGFATFRILATPIDRSYVPMLGTEAAGSYDVSLVWDAFSPGKLMNVVDESRATRPNVFLYFGVLSVDERINLRQMTLPRNKGYSPIVVDDAVIAWLSTRPEAGWRITQRVTLPFTTLNPYAPFAGGEVPDEVFVGRSEERRQIEGRTDSMFVYGGRQLGKSALLRRVERMFDDATPVGDRHVGNRAVYIDLKAAGIGEALEPAALWPLLGERLREAGIISAQTGRNPTADTVTGQIRSWVDSDSSNRLLLLLDEADNFLTADSRPGQGGMSGSFEVFLKLKGAMAATDRRFKTVFAGLHQVQRFQEANSPIAHGGKEILIGPLGNRDAYKLVVDPMLALGYRFQDAELVWRLLLLTNYQASLVQIVCEALVRHLRGRPLPKDGSRIRITDEDVDAVSSDPAVNGLLAERFRWTINLDSRYRVIALVVAMRSLDSTPGVTFDASELLQECQVWWPAGFDSAEFTIDQFKRYLAEMVGLGVLHESQPSGPAGLRRKEGLWGLRSPNIIRMLGTVESLNQELAEAADHLEPSQEYDPSMNRRSLPPAGPAAPRSPLTDYDLTRLLDPTAGDTTHVVYGSPALGITRVANALQAAAADADGVVCERWDAADIRERLAQKLRRRLHVIVDFSEGGTAAQLRSTLEQLGKPRHRLSSTVIVESRLLDQAPAHNLPVHTLRRWTMTGLRTWPESPFDSPRLRERLYRVTSGWPTLVERVMSLIHQGSSQDAALNRVIDEINDPVWAAAFLEQCGVDRGDVGHWSKYFETTDPDGLLRSTPASLTDLSTALEREAAPVVARYQKLDVVSEDHDGWLLDRVVTAAAAAVRD